MRAEPVITTSERGSVRVLADPWRIGTADDGTEIPFHDPPFPKGSYTAGPQIVDGLTRSQLNTVMAAHEAGHAVMYHLFGMPIVEVSLYMNDPRSPEPGLAPGHGHTMLADDKPRLYVPHIVSGYLAGQVASQMWLEHAGLLTPERRFLTQKFAAADHEAVLGIDSDVPVAYLYGDAKPPTSWTSEAISVDEVITATRERLATAWNAVAALTAYLDEHSYADGKTVLSLISGS